MLSDAPEGTSLVAARGLISWFNLPLLAEVVLNICPSTSLARAASTYAAQFSRQPSYLNHPVIKKKQINTSVSE